MGTRREFMGGRAGRTIAVMRAFALAGMVILTAGWPLMRAGAARAADPTFLMLSPDPELPESPGDAVIAISILDPDHEVDGASIQLMIDNIDMTRKASVTPDLVSFVPDTPLSGGVHRIELKLRAIGGAELPGFRQDLHTEGRLARAEAGRTFETRGRLTLEHIGDDLSGAGASLRQEPGHTSTGRLDMDGHLSGWKYKMGLFFTSDENGGVQPRDRYSLHVDHNWVGVDLGDVNYDFSAFTLQGKRSRGVGGFLRLGDTRIEAIRGTIDRRIGGTVSVTTDSVSGLPDTVVVGETYERKLIGARVEVGEGKTYQTGLDVIRVRDDVKSIPFGLNPKDNLVIGSNLVWAPFHRRVIIQGDAAISALTDDISGGAITTAQLDSLINGTNLPSWFNPKSWENVYILNLSTTPLNPKGVPNLAWQGSVKGNVLGNVFQARYQSVGPAFNSLAAPSIQNDKQGLRLTDAVRVLHDKLALDGEFETFNDNLKNDKQYTTDTGIMGVNATFVPGRVDIKNITVGYRRYHRNNDAPGIAVDSTGAPDSTLASQRIDETTNTFRIGAGYHFYWLPFFTGHELNANYIYAKTDAFESEGRSKQTDWSFNYETRFTALPLGANLQFGLNNTEYPGQVPASNVKYTTLGAGGTYDFMDRRLTTFTSAVNVSGKGSGTLGSAIEGTKFTWTAGAQYKVNPRASVMGRVSVVRFSDNVPVDPLIHPAKDDYSENVINLRLVQEF